MGEVPSALEQIPELPSDDLMFRVAGTSYPLWFWRSGKQSVDQISAVLSHVGKSFKDFPRALDFGCGCGRMMLHLKDIGTTTELFGVDIDAEAIAWAREHIPWAKFSVNQGLPPLEFPDEYFDLVFNHSVFTHLDERYQDAWLVELERITKPGAAVILSVSGEHVFAEFEKKLAEWGRDPQPLRETLHNRGILFIADDGALSSPFPDFYHTTFHAPWYVFERWGSIFDIRAYVVRGDLEYQDLVLLTRREQRVGTVPPLADLPTKLNQSRTEVSQLRRSLRECEQDKQSWRSAAAKAQSDLQNVLSSRSWRVTAPLRGFMSLFRSK